MIKDYFVFTYSVENKPFYVNLGRMKTSQKSDDIYAAAFKYDGHIYPKEYSNSGYNVEIVADKLSKEAAQVIVDTLLRQFS